MKSRRLIASLVLVSLFCFGVYGYWDLQEQRAEHQRNVIGAVVLQDAMAHFGRLVPPHPNTRYVLYEAPGNPVSSNLVYQLRDVVPQVVTGGDPEFINGPNDHSFMLGNIEHDHDGNVVIWVKTNIRGNVTKADGTTQYTLAFSGTHWIIKERKFEGRNSIQASIE